MWAVWKITNCGAEQGIIVSMVSAPFGDEDGRIAEMCRRWMSRCAFSIEVAS